MIKATVKHFCTYARKYFSPSFKWKLLNQIEKFVDDKTGQMKVFLRFWFNIRYYAKAIIQITDASIDLSATFLIFAI